MLKAWAQKNGFTIIELLVSIAVIGIIAGIIIVSYSGIQKTSRDSERTSDITLIKIALEKYHAELSTYPAVCSADNSGCSVSNLEAALKPYLNEMPHDPVNPSGGTLDYNYVRSAVAFDAYALLVQYESKPVCKTGVNVSAGWWGAGVPTC